MVLGEKGEFLVLPGEKPGRLNHLRDRVNQALLFLLRLHVGHPRKGEKWKREKCTTPKIL